MKHLIALVIAALLGVFALPALAQDATPGPPDSFELAPGVTADSAVFVEGQESPSLYRLCTSSQGSATLCTLVQT